MHIRACKQLLRNKCSSKKGCILYPFEIFLENLHPELKCKYGEIESGTVFVKFVLYGMNSSNEKCKFGLQGANCMSC